MQTPIVSVIMPVYNKANTVQEAATSALMQINCEIELIAIDDGSTDQSWNILQKLSKNDSRITLLQQRHRGAASARNAGLRIARGKYIAFQDADDIHHKKKSLMQIEALEMQQAGLCYTYAWSIDENRTKTPPHWEKPMPKPFYPNLLRISEVGIATPTVMIPKAVILDVGNFNETLSVCEDIDLWRRIAMRYPVILLPVKTASIRKRHSPNHNDPRDEQARLHLYELSFADDPNLEKTWRKTLLDEFYHHYALRYTFFIPRNSAKAWEFLRKSIALHPWPKRIYLSIRRIWIVAALVIISISSLQRRQTQ